MSGPAIGRKISAGPVVAVGDPWHDAAYAVYDGAALRHVEIERFTRHKYEQVNPLIYGGLSEPDVFASAGTLLIEEGRFLAPLVREMLEGKELDVESQARQLIETQAGSLSVSPAALELAIGNIAAVLKSIQSRRTSVEIYDHHFAHAAHAFVGSPFEDATVVTLDGGGTHKIDDEQVQIHGSVYHMARARPLPRAAEYVVRDWSPGWAWTRACNLLGMSFNEAGTVMAMAAFGSPSPDLAALVRHDDFWAICPWDLPQDCRERTDKLVERIGEMLTGEASRFALAHELQAETERRVRAFMAPFLDADGEVDLCLSGGTFLNCIVAGKVQRWFPNVRGLYIPPVPYDAGICLGMLEAFIHDRQDGDVAAASTPRTPGSFALGKRYGPVEILAACRSQGCADPERRNLTGIAEDLDAGKVVAVFHGSSESGRRALGNRSILCDPRNAANKEKLNNLIKKRQWFRPFAPMILAECAEEWFEVDPGFSSPFMTYALLQAWRDVSGIPILLNTSFNDSEPIVETPSEAVATVFRSGIDRLYFADYGLVVENPAAASWSS
jgi:carbamoyltransferase